MVKVLFSTYSVFDCWALGVVALAVSLSVNENGYAPGLPETVPETVVQVIAVDELEHPMPAGTLLLKGAGVAGGKV